MFSDVDSAVDFLMTVRPITRKPGLFRMRELMRLLGDPQKKMKFVHVAGTNGKGSTCAFISSILRAAGYTTGLYISPHLKRFNERISVNGIDIPDERLIDIADRIKDAAELLEEMPSVFELITAVAFVYFKECECDIVVLEVGMGGILDSTNIIDTPEAAVITPIGLDHCAILGNTLSEIAWNKAGIIKEQGRVAAYHVDNDVDNVYRSKCAETGAELRFADFDEIHVISSGLNGIEMELGDLKGIMLPLVGTYQPKNAALAVTAIRFLMERGWEISDDDIVSGLNNVIWPGRFDVLCREPVVILDGSHNPHGFTATAESLRCYFPEKKFIFVMGIMEDKDFNGVLDICVPLAKKIIAVAPDDGRALSAERLAEYIKQRGVDSVSEPTVGEAIHRAFLSSNSDDVICAFGSLYISAEVRECVKRECGC